MVSENEGKYINGELSEGLGRQASGSFSDAPNAKFNQDSLISSSSAHANACTDLRI